MRKLKWLYPGMKVKRWLLLCLFGVLMVALSFVRFIPNQVFTREVALISIIIGLVIIVISIKGIVKSLLVTFLPEQKEKKLVDIVYNKRYLEKGPKIVVIGGGTGLSVLLHGLKEYTTNISAIVTVADEGGSSGKLRNQFDMLPPGDIRNCLVALADAEPLMQQLFQFRFKETELDGHNFGNLFITAMLKITGDFEKAIQESSKILAIKGKVIPATTEKVRLVATYTDGRQAVGETNIVDPKSTISRLSLSSENCRATIESVEAIRKADAIILGPGSLYTSILPNLLIKEITTAITESMALKIYVCNVMTQPGETDRYNALDHLKAVIAHTNKDIINLCVVNNAYLPDHLLTKYENENSYVVRNNAEEIRAFGYSVIEDNVVSVKDYIRHDSEKLARVIIDTIIKFKDEI